MTWFRSWARSSSANGVMAAARLGGYPSGRRQNPGEEVGRCVEGVGSPVLWDSGLRGIGVAERQQQAGKVDRDGTYWMAPSSHSTRTLD